MKKLIWFLGGSGLALVIVGLIMISPLWPTRAQERTAAPTSVPGQPAQQTPQATPQPQPTATPSTFSLVWEREGGIAGRCDRLTIFEGDQVHYGYCDEGLRFADLGQDDWKTYMGYVARYRSFAVTLQDNPNGPDNMSTAVRFSGRGSQEADIAAQQEIAGWADALYQRLRMDEKRADLVALSRSLLAQKLGVVADSLVTVGVEEVTWPDACLGLPVEGLHCAQVGTRGLRVMLQAGSETFEVRTDWYDQARLTQPEATATPEPTAQISPTAMPLPTATSWPSAMPTPTWTPLPTLPPVTITDWRGEYYANPSLSGGPTVVRNDVDIRFDWGLNAPSPGLPSDNFSVRWRRYVQFSEGEYDFRLRTDDGAKLWIAGNLIIDQWWSGAHDITVRQRVMTGQHEVVVAYYEASGEARARLSWEKVYAPKSPTPTRTAVPEPVITEWRGAYYVGAQINDVPMVIRNDQQISFDWGAGAPAEQLPSDGFAVRWTRSLPLDRGAYRFHTSVVGSVRVQVDGQAVISQWDALGDQVGLGHLWLESGFHDITVDYRHSSGRAAARFWIESLQSYSGWKAEYFRNSTLQGNPYLVRDDDAINFDWGTGQPDLGLPQDRFSVRWSRQTQFSSGRYRFYAYADDGVRVYVDNRPVIDEWHDSPGQHYAVMVDLEGGAHTIVVEYYEDGASARVSAGWEQISGPSPTPTATVEPTSTATWTPPPTATALPTLTPTPSATATDMATLTPTSTATEMPTLTPTATATLTLSPSASVSPSVTLTLTPTGTLTITATATWYVGRPEPTTSLTPSVLRTPQYALPFSYHNVPEGYMNQP